MCASNSTISDPNKKISFTNCYTLTTAFNMMNNREDLNVNKCRSILQRNLIITLFQRTTVLPPTGLRPRTVMIRHSVGAS